MNVKERAMTITSTVITTKILKGPCLTRRILRSLSQIQEGLYFLMMTITIIFSVITIVLIIGQDHVMENDRKEGRTITTSIRIR